MNQSRLESLSRTVSIIEPIIEKQQCKPWFLKKYAPQIDSLGMEKLMGRRIVYSLAWAKLTTPDTIFKALLDRKILKIRNFGRKGYVTLCRWLELPTEENNGQLYQCPCCSALVQIKRISGVLKLQAAVTA